MGVRFNRDGMVLQAVNGQLIQDSMVSAHSGKRIGPGGVMEKVPGSTGLFVRLTPIEARQLSRAQREIVYEKARTWRSGLAASVDPVPVPPAPVVPNEDDDEETLALMAALDALTLSQLQDVARQATLTGYSKLSKTALIDLLVAHDVPLDLVQEGMDADAENAE